MGVSFYIEIENNFFCAADALNWSGLELGHIKYWFFSLRGARQTRHMLSFDAVYTFDSKVKHSQAIVLARQILILIRQNRTIEGPRNVQLLRKANTLWENSAARHSFTHFTRMQALLDPGIVSFCFNFFVGPKANGCVRRQRTDFALDMESCGRVHVITLRCWAKSKPSELFARFSQSATYHLRIEREKKEKERDDGAL